MRKKIGVFICFLLSSIIVKAQDTTEYHLTIENQHIRIGGKEAVAMTVNGSVPGPVLEFTEGGYAVIYVHNKMDVETSVHWHGLLLPNFYDGVPYLTTPPIRPGVTFKYEFPLRQSGTYWYHSHTMLQEQKGVYGGIVIHPAKAEKKVNEEVIVLSDWTNEKPEKVLQNLKRGNEWYGIAKGTSVPLSRVIGRGALGAQLNFWRQRMEGADIADIYYPHFLMNAKDTLQLEASSSSNLRLRFINASASSQYWLSFGGGNPRVIAADGIDVEAVEKSQAFIAIAETYDFLLTVQPHVVIEILAMAQDGSGFATAYLGEGEDTLFAEKIPRPDKIAMMQRMAKMDMRMGAPASKFNPTKEEPHEMKEKWGMQMQMPSGMKESHMSHEGHSSMDDMKMYAEYSYDFLKATEPTAFADSSKRRDILLNLTGNMWRYIWSINGVPLAESDKIKIQKGEVVRITLNNLTMMHHPMHLHGHFFRVINKNGEYSPLKHTVNIPPMGQTTIEFAANESGDWFFHCHVLYHMMSGMARVYSYGTPRDKRLQDYPISEIIKEGNHYYSWATATAASHMAGFDAVISNTRNMFSMDVEFGWNRNYEAEISYEYFLYDYLRIFGGLNMENEIEESLQQQQLVGVAGIRFFTPYMFNLDVRIDHLLRPQLRLSREVLIFPRTVLNGSYEYQMDFGWAQYSEQVADSYRDESVWSVGLEYFLSRDFSLMVSYDNRFGGGAGLQFRF